jgi:hypothetical protein
MKNDLSKKDQIFFLTPYLVFLLQKNLSKKMMWNRSKFLRTWVFEMSKTIFLYNLWKIVGWKGLCIYVEELFFFV